MHNNQEDEFASPSKKLRNNIADPEYKPFSQNSSSHSSYSSFSSKSNKSEDDSPQRRKIIKSPTKRRVALLTEQEHN